MKKPIPEGMRQREQWEEHLQEEGFEEETVTAVAEALESLGYAVVPKEAAVRVGDADRLWNAVTQTLPGSLDEV